MLTKQKPAFLSSPFRWRGSIYKLVWLDLAVFLFVYYILNIWYRVIMHEEQKRFVKCSSFAPVNYSNVSLSLSPPTTTCRIFEGIIKYCATYTNLIPLSFVLGFYVSIVMTRWWSQYTTIPWPDPIAVFVSANVHGQVKSHAIISIDFLHTVTATLLPHSLRRTREPV